MKACEQTKGMSIYEHGLSVRNYLFDIVNHLKYGNELKYQWKIPDWIYKHKNIILDGLLPLNIIEEYAIFHDCGKPYCRKVENGTVHFTDHAKVSHDIWNKYGRDYDVGQLILRDMDIHLLKSGGVKKFSESKYATTLLLSGLAEIHSNADMFGGINSTNFKIKWKHINRRGKSIIKFITEGEKNG